MSVNQSKPDNLAYFAPILPWQKQGWMQLVTRFERLPHALLFAGMQGIGKRAFVWRFVAWLLCDNKTDNQQAACGHCQSCLWLAAGTHQDLMVLPTSSIPIPKDDEQLSKYNNSANPKNGQKTNQKTKQNKKSSAASNTADVVHTSIKVDDVRELQPFISQGSSGVRVCVIDNADSMTIAAANALLKTLEEPRAGIYILLITDTPTKLLPTIKSRVQKVAIDYIDTDIAKDYLSDAISTANLIDYQEDGTMLRQHVEQSLRLANGAPLAALAMLTSEWYQYRDIWLKAWLALRVGKRSIYAASDYWQKTLVLSDFLKLSEIMLMDFSRCSLGMPALQLDLQLANYASVRELKIEDIQEVMQVIEDIKQSYQQNVQDKLCYDRLMLSLQRL